MNDKQDSMGQPAGDADGPNPFTLTTDELAGIFTSTRGRPPLPPYEDRARWAAASKSSTGRTARTVAERALKRGPAMIRARDYLAYWSEGDRKRFDRLYRSRRRDLVSLVIAELGEGEGRYLSAVNDYLWSICEETSWLLSAHLQHGLDTDLPPKRAHYIDMDSAMTAVVLAEVVALLREHIHPEITRRVAEEIRERVFDIYFYRRDIHWMHADDNWNSASHCGIIGSACYLMNDPHELARMTHKGLSHLRTFLKGFDSDGATAEGINCWQVGVAHLCILDSILVARTDGRLSLLRHVSGIDQIATFPERINLSDHNYANFSDAPERFVPAPFISARLRDVLGLDLVTFDHDSVRAATFALRNALVPSEVLSTGYENRRLDVYFRGVQWFVSRTSADDDALVLAAKGGHNGENHNHNDLGHFIVHWRRFSYFIDLGRPVFNRLSFTSERYSILANGSRGHSVPLINGFEQGAGRQFAAGLVALETGSASHVEYDLASAYPGESGLSAFRRRVELVRDGIGEARVSDAIELDAEGEVEHCFYCAVQPVQASDCFVLESDRGALTFTLTASVDGERTDSVAPEVTYLEDAGNGAPAYRLSVAQRGRELMLELAVRPAGTEE